MNAVSIICDPVNFLVKFPHPRTVLNPKEWNEIEQVRLDSDGKVFVRSFDSAWFNFAKCEIQKKGLVQNESV